MNKEIGNFYLKLLRLRNNKIDRLLVVYICALQPEHVHTNGARPVPYLVLVCGFSRARLASLIISAALVVQPNEGMKEEKSTSCVARVSWNRRHFARFTARNSELPQNTLIGNLPLEQSKQR